MRHVGSLSEGMLRNWLARHYFWERAGSILSWNGRE
jgi:hypothetical protein